MFKLNLIFQLLTSSNWGEWDSDCVLLIDHDFEDHISHLFSELWYFLSHSELFYSWEISNFVDNLSTNEWFVTFELFIIGNTIEDESNFINWDSWSI